MQQQLMVSSLARPPFVKLMQKMTEKTRSLPPGLLVRRTALFLGCTVLFELLLIAFMPRLHSGSVLKIAKDCAVMRLRNDSWTYLAQADAASRFYPNAIYENVFFKRDIRFIYPPVSLLLYRACQAAAGIGIPPFTALKLLLIASFIGTWLAAAAFLFRIIPQKTRRELTRVQRWLLRLIIAALVCTFLPLVNGPFLGQVQTILSFLLIAGALLWLEGRRISPGLLLGLSCWLKPQMALFLVWGMLRRQSSFAASLAGMLALGIAVSVAVFGIHNTVEYVTLLHYLGQRGDALFTNQSLNGLLHRQMHVGSPLTWRYGYPPFNRVIYIATLVSSAAILLLALTVPLLRRQGSTIADFLLFAMGATMASPIAWEHHYGVFFLGFLLWIPEATSRWRTFLLLLGIYFLMTDTWAPVTLLMYTPWTFLISHIYFGGLMLFFWTMFRWQRDSAQHA